MDACKCTEDKSDTITIRAALVGDSGVGKTSILLRYTDNKFIAEIGSTLGIDWRTKQLQVDGKKVKLQIWDTAGQESFSYTVPVIFRRANVILLVYDITNMKSFQSVSHWMNQIPIQAETYVILVGTKSDLESDREVTTQMGKRRAEELLPEGVPFFETSAKENHNIDALFLNAVSNQFNENVRGECSCDKVNLINTQQHERRRCC